MRQGGHGGHGGEADGVSSGRSVSRVRGDITQPELAGVRVKIIGHPGISGFLFKIIIPRPGSFFHPVTDDMNPKPRA